MFKSLLKHHSSKASILKCLAFFMVQLSHPYTTTGKTYSFDKRMFFSKVMSLFFNKLSRFVIAFLPRSSHLNFMASVNICSDLGAQKNKIYHCFHFPPFYLPWSDGTRCHDLSFFECWILIHFFSSYLTIALILHAGKVMFKLLQARLQQYRNQ